MKVFFNDKEVQKLLDDFQILIGVRIAVFDTSFNELYSSPKTLSPFCKSVRKNESINKECMHCDIKAFNQARINKDVYIYKCHMGLYETVTPLYNNQQILGYVMIGQVLDNKNKDIQWNHLTQKYKFLSNSLCDSKEYYYNLKQMSLEEIKAASHIMKTCAISIWLQYIIDIESSPISNRIETYIDNHYTEKILTNTICKDLGISKTTMYYTLKQEHNMSLTKYINRYRLSKSKELLKNKKLSIADVAYRVGFDDYNYFTRLFKIAYNITPSKYRNSH